MAATGRAKTGGRKKGSPNKVTKELKTMILGALDENGGQKYLSQQAQENPTAFLQLLGKILPNEMKAQVSSVDGAIFNIGIASRCGK